MGRNRLFYLFIRYLALVLLGLFDLALFYWVFTPLTVYPVYLILVAIGDGTRLLAGNLLFFNGMYAKIIPACVAGAAYYLLLILNLTTPMKIGTRAKSLGFMFFTFLVLNVARILVFSIILAAGFQYFDIAHRMVWYFGSTLMVVAIWFVNVWLFKIKHIPVYNDLRNIFSETKFGK